MLLFSEEGGMEDAVICQRFRGGVALKEPFVALSHAQINIMI